MKKEDLSVTSINVEEYVYERVKKSDVVINIPQEPIYFQEYNRRVIIGLFPEFATWGDNSVWQIQIVKITGENIERTYIRTNSKELSDIISRFEYKNKSSEDHLKDKVVRYLKDYFARDMVNKEVFTSHFKSYMNGVAEIANLINIK